MGIAHLFCDYEEQNKPEYMGVLNRIEKAVSEGMFANIAAVRNVA